MGGEHWPVEARRVFEASPKREQDAHSHIMLLGVHPTEHNGNPAWGCAEVYVLKSPGFCPEKAKPHELLAIGCRVHVPEFKSTLEEVSRDNDRRMLMMHGEMGRIGGMGTMLAINLTGLLEKRRPKGISSHLHLCWVLRGQVVLKTNDHQRTGRWSAWPIGQKRNRLKAQISKCQGLPPTIPSSFNFAKKVAIRLWEQLHDP